MGDDPHSKTDKVRQSAELDTRRDLRLEALESKVKTLEEVGESTQASCAQIEQCLNGYGDTKDGLIHKVNNMAEAVSWLKSKVTIIAGVAVAIPVIVQVVLHFSK